MLIKHVLLVVSYFQLKLLKIYALNFDEYEQLILNQREIIFKYPFMISIHLVKEFPNHVCAGTILDAYWILTAAHCISDKE